MPIQQLQSVDQPSLDEIVLGYATQFQGLVGFFLQRTIEAGQSEAVTKAQIDAAVIRACEALRDSIEPHHGWHRSEHWTAAPHTQLIEPSAS